MVRIVQCSRWMKAREEIGLSSIRSVNGSFRLDKNVRHPPIGSRIAFLLVGNITVVGCALVTADDDAGELQWQSDGEFCHIEPPLICGDRDLCFAILHSTY